MASSSRPPGRVRVLGTPKPPAAPASPVPDRVQHGGGGGTGILSPSDSTVSLNSRASTPKTSLEDGDISAAVASSAYAAQIPAQGNVAATASRMVCPICNEGMVYTEHPYFLGLDIIADLAQVTLLQLNRHLDDDHKDIAVVEQDEVKTWFKTQVIRAKKFQPLAVLNQKLKGLDIFEPEDEVRTRSTSPAAAHSGRQQQQQGQLQQPEAPIVQVPDDIIKKDHWQRYTKDGLCTDPLCDHRLGAANGNVNCRKCGSLYCSEHTMYQMKLSRSAQWDPVRGLWYRVCETCYKSRDGYNDHNGFERDHMKEFSKLRRAHVDKSYLEVSRLEKRLTKLTHLLSDPSLHQESNVVRKLWSFSSNTPDLRRQLEQSVVDWEEDVKVSQCPFCRQEFSNYSFRRHHCRICGRVVCADPQTGCSSEIGLNVLTQSKEYLELNGTSQMAVDVRMCQDCKRTIFSKSDFAAELARQTPDQRAFDNLKQFERGIRAMLPRFQKLLAALQDPEKPPTASELADASRARKRITEAFTQYSVAARRIKELPSTSATQLRLQQQVFLQASNFLHVHMLPLKALPKVLKHAAPHGGSASGKQDGRLHPHAAVRPSISHSASPSFDSTDAPSQSSVVSELEGEERELSERLIVLEEQRFMVGEMLRDAQRRRKFDEAESLGRNVEEIDRECNSVRATLEEIGRGVGEAYIGVHGPKASARDKRAVGNG